MEADHGQGGEEGGQGVDGGVLIERENQTRLKTFLSLCFWSSFEAVGLT